MRMRSTYYRVAADYHQRGMSLLQVMLIIVLIGTIIATGFQLLRAGKQPQHAVDAHQVTQWADQAVAAFAAAHSRLPCPAAEPAGREDCTSGVTRGYLPIGSIDSFFDENARSLIGLSGKGAPPGALLYAIGQPQTQAGEVLDLSRAGGWFQPLTYVDDRYEVRKNYERDAKLIDYDAVNGLDFCMALARLAIQPLSNSRLHVTRGSSTKNIAYAVGVAGLSTGAAEALAPASAQNQIVLTGQASTAPDDSFGHVRTRTLEDLGQSLGCTLFSKQTLASARTSFADAVPLVSLDLAADALDLNEQVEQTEADTLSSADENLSSAQMAMLMAVISTGMAARTIDTAAAKIGEDSILLSLHSLRCIVSLGVECWRVPITSAALGLDIAALASAGAAFAATAIEAGFTGKALADANAVQRMAEAAAKPPIFDLSEAIKQAYDAIYGVCNGTGATQECEINGTQQNLKAAEDTLKSAQGKASLFQTQYLTPWTEPHLLERIVGCTSTSTSPYCRNAKNQLVDQISRAQNLVIQTIALDELKGELKGLQDKRSQIDEMLKPAGEFSKQTNASCAGTSEQDARICKANRDAQAFAKTCTRNGVLHQYNGQPYEQIPLCYLRIDEAIADMNKKIAAQQQIYRQELNAANAVGATRDMSATWIPEVRDENNVLVTAGYFRADSPYQFRYPSDWTHCSAGDDKISGCIGPYAFLSWWRYGDYLPLVRTNTNQKWFSYGDAYRTFLTLEADAKAAEKAVAEAKIADDKAKEAYATLSAAATDDGTGNNTELWIGPHAILKAMDDRGSVGPDRSGVNQAEINP